MPHHLPAASLLANVDSLRALDADFVITLGDVYWRLEDRWVTAFDTMIMDHLAVPFVNAVGNHDITRYTGNDKVVLDAEDYRNRFGATYFAFRAAADLHIVVDTVTDGRSIKGTQKTFLEQQVARAEKDPGIRNVLFWSHHLLWTQIDPEYRWLKGNPGNWNFKSEIYPLIRNLAKSKKVFWGSGNFGEPPNISLFFDHRQEENMSVFATGIGDTRHDLILHVTVGKGAGITITPVSLTGAKLPGVETFDVNANRRVADEWYALNWDFLVVKPRPNPPSFREKLETVMGIRYFWHGVVIASAVWLGLIFSIAIFQRIRRRSS